jgi:hypothetical protein
MYLETLINDTVVVSIVLAETGRAGAAEAEFNSLVSATKALCELDETFPLIMFGRAHKVLHCPPGDSFQGTCWTHRPDGGCDATIVLAAIDTPVQRVCLKIKLMRTFSEAGTTHRLEIDYNPTTILAGNNVHPVTIVDETGKAKPYPSSHFKTMKQIYRLGFNLLEDLFQQASGTNAPLFHPYTRKTIEFGEIHTVRAQWAGYLPTSDVKQFLQLLGLLFGHTIAKGNGLMQLAQHLGFTFEIYKDKDDLTVTGVMFRKKHGEKPLFSLVFYDKRKRVADMRQSKSLSLVEAQTVVENVRFDITAHSEGVLAIVGAARKHLNVFLERGFVVGTSWADEFLTDEPKADVWWLERAIYLLSLCFDGERMVRKSFSNWLVPHVLEDLLHLRALTMFSRFDLYELYMIDDKVAAAWRETEDYDGKAWAKVLAEKAGCSEQTVRSRRKFMLEEYGVDTKAPFASYRDIVLFGTQSLTEPTDRSAMLAALQNEDGAGFLSIWDGSACELDRQREEVLAHSINCGPLRMQVKVAKAACTWRRQRSRCIPQPSTS